MSEIDTRKNASSSHKSFYSWFNSLEFSQPHTINNYGLAIKKVYVLGIKIEIDIKDNNT